MNTNVITEEFIKEVHKEYKILQDNLTDKDIVKSLDINGWPFDIYKVKNKFYSDIDNRRYIFFAAGYHSEEGVTIKRINILNLQSIRQIEVSIKNTFKLWKNLIS